MKQEGNWMKAYHNGVVGSGDERDEEGQHHVDEQRDKGVKVDLAEDPHQRAALLHLGERYKHVVSVDQREEALRHHGQGAELYTQHTLLTSRQVASVQYLNEAMTRRKEAQAFFIMLSEQFKHFVKICILAMN